MTTAAGQVFVQRRLPFVVVFVSVDVVDVVAAGDPDPPPRCEPVSWIPGQFCWCLTKLVPVDVAADCFVVLVLVLVVLVVVFVALVVLFVVRACDLMFLFLCLYSVAIA